MIKIMCVVGARPNFIKIAPLIEEMNKHTIINHILVHTGQHYDADMSISFFDDLDIPKPDIDLNVGSGSHAVQTAEIMKAFEVVCINQKPDYVLVVGDVNSTLACSLVAKKLGIKIIHVEAGLRSNDDRMPEEINRILTDKISDLLFITEKDAEVNLINEGIKKEKIHFTGNVMIDTLIKNSKKCEQSNILEKLKLSRKKYCLVTIHRPSNVDEEKTLRGLLQILCSITDRIPIVFPIHPRTKRKIIDNELESYLNNLITCNPLGYLDFMTLIKNSLFVITDSGGIQEETTFLGVPCLTIRENTERPITITKGTNILVGTNPENLLLEVNKILDCNVKITIKKENIPELWDGKSSERIVQIILKDFYEKRNEN